MQWEYRNERVASPGNDPAAHDRKMSELGEQGWELCACVFDEARGDYRMFFKRMKPTAQLTE